MNDTDSHEPDLTDSHPTDFNDTDFNDTDFNDTDFNDTEPEPMADDAFVPPADPRSDPSQRSDPSPSGAPLGGPQASATPPSPERRLRRSPRGPFGGVANGIAEFLGVEALFVQLAFVALTLLGGSGLFIYLAGWLLIPDESSTDPRRVVVSDRAVNVIAGAVFAAIAISLVFGSLTFGPSGEFIAAIVIVALGLYFLNQRPDEAAPPPTASQVSTASRVNTASQITTGAFAEPAPAQPAPFTASPFTPAAPSSATPPAPTTDTHWAQTHTVDDVAPAAPMEPAPPAPPITSVTVAIAAVIVGALLAVDQLTSASISSTVMFGAALATIGAGLLFSAFVGRAYALIPIGIVTAFGLLIAPIIDLTIDGGSGVREIAIVTEADLQARYELGAGPIELDLSGLELTEDRTVEVAVGAGYAEIWVPDDVNVRVVASSDFGYVEVFGRESAGVGAARSITVPPRGELIAPPPPPAPGESSDEVDPTINELDEVPTLTIEVDVRFGYAEVRR